ncbi:MAG: zeta toxin family protein [Desulfobacterales bacterium]|jgi:hypothetical protein|nr:zeta toxin family protein [Desulfobacterales bacterium]
MKPELEPLDLSAVRTAPSAQIPRRVAAADAARPWRPGGSFAAFLERLPGMLAAADLKTVIAAVAEAAGSDRPVVFAMGAHVVKVGLGPIVIDLMERRVITGVAMNGAGIIHDVEMAMSGRTSEDVGPALNEGSFGMAAETSGFLNRALAAAPDPGAGLGRIIGEAVQTAGFPGAGRSILAAGARLGLPVSVHVAIGTDVIHMHPGFDAARTGAASHADFRLLAAQIARLEGGVFINAGSAVVLPEVFLKALNVARNLGFRVDAFTAVNLDFVRHYRPMVNVVSRPTVRGGTGINLVGHHEIMLPLIAAGVIEALREAPG